MSNTYFILLCLGMIVATYIVRLSVIGLAGRFEMSERFKKTLRFVPVTVLPAIIAVEVLGTAPNLAFTLDNPKVLAAIICTLVSLKFDLVWVVISGMMSLVLFKILLGA